MAHIVTLKDHNDEISYPITPVDAVFVDSNTTLDDALDEKADTDLVNVNAGSVTTGKIANGAVTSQKIDFTTFPHVVACGAENYGALSPQGSTNISVAIPTQPDTNYYVSVANDNSNAYWTKLYFKIGTKTINGFTIYVYNDGTTGQNTGAGVMNYIVSRND